MKFQPLTGSMDWTGAGEEQFKPYVCTKPTGLSRGVLVAFQNRINFPGRLQHTDLHATLMYSVSEISRRLARMSQMGTLTFVAKPVELAIFGLEKDCLVLKLKSKDLEERNRFWQDLGCKMSFEEYSPHLTLYNKPQLSDLTTTAEDWQFRMEAIKEEMQPYIKKMPELVFNGEWVEPIKEKDD